MSKIKQRDWSVELMRIIACVIVIGCHTVPQPISVTGGGIFLFQSIFTVPVWRWRSDFLGHYRFFPFY